MPRPAPNTAESIELTALARARAYLKRERFETLVNMYDALLALQVPESYEDQKRSHVDMLVKSILQQVEVITGEVTTPVIESKGNT